MEKTFGHLADGREARLYTIESGRVRAEVTSYGASLVSLWVDGVDVCLGCDDVRGYEKNGAFLGATVGRNANRMKGASFLLNGEKVQLPANEGSNNLHSGPDSWGWRLWEKTAHTVSSLTLSIHSPHGDQGFPGNATIRVTYSLDSTGGLHIVYDAVCDQDTVFNLTNHSYFNLAGHHKVDAAMEQYLSMPARFFNPDDAESIPTGELRSVEGSPMDFRTPKPIGQDIGADYDALNLQGGYDHNWEVFCNPCAILSDPVSGRTMEVHTDCPGIQVYAGNYLDEHGKNGIYYGKRTGVALETQFYPDCLHHGDWPQPVVKAGEAYHSETVYRFV